VTERAGLAVARPAFPVGYYDDLLSSIIVNYQMNHFGNPAWR
jgi:hypothetical protein